MDIISPKPPPVPFAITPRAAPPICTVRNSASSPEDAINDRAFTLFDDVIGPNTSKLPVNKCVSSCESPNIVEPLCCWNTTLVTDEVTLYSVAVNEPEIITLLPSKDIGSKLPVPSAKLVPFVWTTLW